MKNFVWCGLILLAVVSGCNSNGSRGVTHRFDGRAQGTTYHISYFGDANNDLQTGVDSILKKIDSSLSTYLPASIISRMNSNDSTALADEYFITVFNKSQEVSAKTNGLFDVSIAPVVNAWGFGFSKKENIDSAHIASLLQLVGYQKLALQGRQLNKADTAMKIDFNAIAQGYTVDVLAGYLQKKDVQHFLVELGGELFAKGKKGDSLWKVGIDLPLENDSGSRKIGAVIPLQNRALATSGNYRKFYEEDGKKFAHIIDPRTGYPARQNILSATVLAGDAITADAYATAFMIMGLQEAKRFLQENKNLHLDVYFIYDENGKWKTYASDSSLHIIEMLP